MPSRYASLIEGPLIDEFREMRQQMIFDSMLQHMLKQFGPLAETELAGGNVPSTELAKVGQLLGAARAVRRRSLRELAAETGIDNTTIGRIERGQANPTIQTLQRLADALGKQLRISIVDVVSEQQASDAQRVELKPRKLDSGMLSEADQFQKNMFPEAPKLELTPLPSLDELFGDVS